MKEWALLTNTHWSALANLEKITVIMEKNVNMTQTQVISTQWILKRPKKLLKAKFFFKGQIWRPKAKKFKFYDFFSDLGQFANNCSERVIGLSKKATKAAKRP